MDENADKIFFGEKPGDYFSVGGCIADLNGDRHDDVILGALGYNSDQGRVYIYYGGPDLDEHADIIIDGEPGVAGGFGRTCTRDSKKVRLKNSSLRPTQCLWKLMSVS